MQVHFIFKLYLCTKKVGLGNVQAQFEEQKHQVTAVDVENLQLIDRLHTMSSEVAFFKTSISEKEKQEEDLHRALEDSTMLESSMRSEIEQQHVRCERLESEIQILKVTLSKSSTKSRHSCRAFLLPC